MANENKVKSVEQQIKESEFVEKLRKLGGEKAAEMGKLFINMDDKEQKMALFVIGCRGYLQLDEIQLKALSIALLRVGEKMPEEFYNIIDVLNLGFSTIAKQEE